MNPVTQFALTYREARDKFHAAARACDLAIESHEIPGLSGIDGEPLATDVALLGVADASALLVLTSGTHGIEGYCGSGCQVGLLADPAFRNAVSEAGIAVLLVHAVNPHGFSHGRRVNEDNVDLNRNFHDFDAPLPVNAAYAEVHPWLLPATWPPSPENEARIGEYIATRGLPAFQAAVSGGQHAFPDGLFYGGARPTWSNHTLRRILRAHASTRSRLGWIDFHTGLGPRGHGELIHAGRDDASQLAGARQCWGDEVTSIYDGSSTSAMVRGIVTSAADDECRPAQFAAVALEYGTVSLPETFAALRADHWIHNHPDAPETLRDEARQRIRVAFYDEADDWKRMVYEKAQATALAAVTHLGAR